MINNGSDPSLQNQFIFTNFAGADGNVYHTDFDAMLEAKTKLESGDEVDELTQATLQRLLLVDGWVFTTRNSPTCSVHGRSDARFGEGVFGEMYISNKRNGIIYQVTNSVPLRGDYNRDHIVDAADYTVWRDSLDQIGYRLPADGNGDGKVDIDDYSVWKKHFGETWSATGSGVGQRLLQFRSLPTRSIYGSSRWSGLFLPVACGELALRIRVRRDLVSKL